MEKRAHGFFGRRDMDMTQGGIVSNLLKFAFPLLLGNFFQQLYNMADTWVIGQTGENGAYAAVGSVGPIVNILIGLFSGLATGAGVVISQYFGAKDREKVEKTVHTALLLTLILGAVFTALGVLATPRVLHLMLQTEGESGEVYPFARRYLTIYFYGLFSMMFYNMGAGILRAIGDSARPFYFLVAAAVTNTGLDLLFVFVFDMGVAGVAWATVIAQTLSALLTLLTLLTTRSAVRFSPKKLRLHGDMLRRILVIGIPSAIQLALTAFSNVFVQSYIAHVNGSQTENLGGWTTYTKLDQLIFLPMQSLSMAVTTFVGQNCGVRDIKRAKKGTRVGLLCALSITGVLIILMELAAPSLSKLFNGDPAIVANASLLLRVLTPFYVCCCVNQILAGALRGSGDSTAPMMIMLCCFVGFRQLYLFIMSHYISNDLLPMALGYPTGWMLCCLCITLYDHFFGYRKYRLPA